MAWIYDVDRVFNFRQRCARALSIILCRLCNGPKTGSDFRVTYKFGFGIIRQTKRDQKFKR